MMEFCVGIAVVFIIFCIISLFAPSEREVENEKLRNEYLRLAIEEKKRQLNKQKENK